jgi:hypothetical protein
MDAKDLRIGNLVVVNNEKYHPKLRGVILEVTGINETRDSEGLWTYSVSLKHINQEPNTYYETYSQFLEYVEPIKLTEDWLSIMLGFKNEGYEKLKWSKNEFSIFGSDEYTFGLKINDTYDINIDTVNHLQNLYSDHTGEELKLKTD